jgi:hypothetical protein
MLAVKRCMISNAVVDVAGAIVELGLDKSNHTERAVPLIGAKPGQKVPGTHEEHTVAPPVEKLPGGHGIGVLGATQENP